MTPAPDPSDRSRRRPEPRASGPEDRQELERFKRDVDLSAFAASKGYALDKRESSASCRVLRQEATNDKIIIGKAGDGHWQYFSVRDRDDNGTIIDFIQRRERKTLGEVRRELREWTHTERELPAFARQPVQPVTKDRAAVAIAVARSTVVETHPYLESRGLTRETLSGPRFQGTWRQADGAHQNVMFLHRDGDGLAGFELKNSGFTGFSRGGDKGLWASSARPTDHRLVIAESAIDALSYHQANPHPKTRYLSFAGGLNERQPELIERAISWMPAGSTVVAATDNDKEGRVFAERIAELCAKHPHVTFERHAPTLGKDWNDQLQALRSPKRPLEPSQRPGPER
ncbi:MAG TPA: toprim domain-containing protein [Polyangiaceae bacterium]|nr:toprim domain-containing protein [Polyangiaceae bacterium]